MSSKIKEVKKHALNPKAKKSSITLTSTSNHLKRQGYVLLSTTKIEIFANNRQTVEPRAILSSGSQFNLVIG